MVDVYTIGRWQETILVNKYYCRVDIVADRNYSHWSFFCRKILY